MSVVTVGLKTLHEHFLLNNRKGQTLKTLINHQRLRALREREGKIERKGRGEIGNESESEGGSDGGRGQRKRKRLSEGVSEGER